MRYKLCKLSSPRVDSVFVLFADVFHMVRNERSRRTVLRIFRALLYRNTTPFRVELGCIGGKAYSSRVP
jgi:hypothetical protein